MSEDDTKILESTPEFRRVQSTLDHLAAHLERVEAYIKTVDEKLDKQGYNTKPMWEKTQAVVEKTQTEIEEVNRNLVNLNRKVELFKSDLVDVRITNREHEERLSRLESDQGGLTTIN